MTTEFVPPSSLLFVPGTVPQRIDKALGSGADLVCVDLEDAVPPEEKGTARLTILEAISSHREKNRLGVRINRIDSIEGIKDIVALSSTPPPCFIMLPKVEHARDIELLATMLGKGVPIIGLIESPRGVEAASSIAAESALTVLMFGSFDYAAETGGTQEWETLLPVRSRIVSAAASAGKAAIESPFADLLDIAAAAQEDRRSRNLGMFGRAAIHPRMIRGINEAYRPSAAELEEARAIVATFEASRGGAARLGGRLIELPVVRRMKQILAREVLERG